jgi:hypothetical protein
VFLTVLLSKVVHLHDIDTIIRDQRDVDEQHDPPMLNLEKWARLKDQAMSAIRYRDVPFAHGKKDLGMALEYLKEALHRVGAEVDARLLQENSAKLKGNEISLQMGITPTGQAGPR